MLILTLRYPGDPPLPVRLMFGAEFKAIVREGKPGRVSVGSPGDMTSFEFDEVICDECNAEVKDTDPCSVDPSRLRCWACTERSILPHAKEMQVSA